jgi:DNA invertase Pin-like site-specific DNA recombinase
MPTRAAEGKLSQRLYYAPKAQLLRYISYQENIDTTTPTGELIFHVMASLAQFESALISQRLQAGMARAKAQNKRVARARLV